MNHTELFDKYKKYKSKYIAIKKQVGSLIGGNEIFDVDIYACLLVPQISIDRETDVCSINTDYDLIMKRMLTNNAVRLVGLFPFRHSKTNNIIKIPFYLSSGENSFNMGVWYPTGGIDNSGYVEKEFMIYFPELNENEAIKQNVMEHNQSGRRIGDDTIGRFGISETMVKLSMAIRDSLDPILKKYYNFNQLDNTYRLHFKGALLPSKLNKMIINEVPKEYQYMFYPKCIGIDKYDISDSDLDHMYENTIVRVEYADKHHDIVLNNIIMRLKQKFNTNDINEAMKQYLEFNIREVFRRSQEEDATSLKDTSGFGKLFRNMTLADPKNLCKTMHKLLMV